ncbi:MAG: hypothetical protein COW73_11295 [Nitrospirae bacterium CG18_big_fil_WC_8_21_14_2_50_70_55]|nr:class I SAM-dependent methyltransferase [Deltaproteobacteria bacterium]OIP66032.1 MAG: hypothetical protein AUK30_03305 [Nitrospirae bacterium CG2_30_70_394]PIQ03406.1 MAG: hypothetical protein COW73_11295 [Nitrospirae bacterium CG18_big_fil_WC_8_21_14_2_50_70_55]PIU79684.1 MAG: hypothetical protein COS73_03140 [Nitrospirae bacterium CG06_land_8_20_14_3_00_70_43]PIW82966.1 MAG: hypothetical protein COZ96_05925 [Nitrospirae bacterium CG_4_8_14_3_um_filter_70_85]PIX83347.1 MAG: hypothetical p
MTLPCPVCATASPLEHRAAPAAIYRCPACDHAFSDPASIRAPESYDPAYYAKVHKHWFANPNIPLFQHVARYLEALGEQPSVLDVGCGKGDFLRYLHATHPNATLTGIDFSPPAAEGGIDYLQGDAASVALDRTFDLVTTFATIEDPVDVHRFVRRLRDWCRPGGYLVVMAVNDRSILFATARLLFRLGLRLPYERLHATYHLHHFNRRSLVRLLTSEGLTVVEHHLHNCPLRAVDTPARSPLVHRLLLIPVVAMFALGHLTGRTYLQTVVCRRG